MKLVLALAAASLAGGCASQKEAACTPASSGCPPTKAAVQQEWRSRITDDDAKRLSNWRDAWTRALAAARVAGAADRIAAEGILLEPDSAQTLQVPAPGAYRCRTIKMGAQSEGLLNYVAYPWFDCSIAGGTGTLRFTKLNGSQRPVGTLLPQTAKRMVFLGTLQLGDETNVLDYGRDRERDMAALLESVGDRRWRLVFPYPHFESLTDIMELVPRESAPR